MKPLLNAKIIKTISAAISNGLSFEYAAITAGINRRTFYVWRKKAKGAKSGVFKELHEALEIADALFVQRSLALISAHGKQNWQAIAWLLERRHPEMFGRYDRMQAQQMKDLADELKLLRGELANRQTT